MTFIVATNVIASRPPERRPTGTPHARANIIYGLRLGCSYLCTVNSIVTLSWISCSGTLDLNYLVLNIKFKNFRASLLGCFLEL